MASDFHTAFAAIAEPSFDAAFGEPITINGENATGRVSAIGVSENEVREGTAHVEELQITSVTAMAIEDLIVARGATYVVKAVDRPATCYTAKCILESITERSKQNYRA